MTERELAELEAEFPARTGMNRLLGSRHVRPDGVPRTRGHDTRLRSRESKSDLTQLPLTATVDDELSPDV